MNAVPLRRLVRVGGLTAPGREADAIAAGAALVQAAGAARLSRETQARARRAAAEAYLAEVNKVAGEFGLEAVQDPAQPDEPGQVLIRAKFIATETAPGEFTPVACTEELVRKVYRTFKDRQPAPALAPAQRTGRNEPCPCGSGKKFKKCCRKP